MHVLIVTNYFPPEIGAASYLYYDLAETLADHGHRATVVTGFPRYRAHAHHGILRKDTVGRSTVIRVASSPFDKGGAIRRGLDHLYLAPSLALGGLLAERPDVILAYSPPLTLGASAWALSRRWSVPFIVNVQDLFPQYAVDVGLLTNRRMIHAFEWLESAIYRSADAVVVNSPNSRVHVLARGGYPDRVTAISNWIDTDLIRPGPTENEFRRAHGLSGKFVVQYAGTMGYQQDLDTVIEAAEILRYDDSIRFQLIGEGVERDRLQARALDLRLSNVLFTPFQPRAEYPQVIQSANVALVVLRPEVKTPAIPSKLLGIMAAGKPVIVSADPLGDAPALVGEVHCGITVQPGHAGFLAEAIRRLRDHADVTAEMGRQGREYAVANLSRETRVADYENVMRRAISSRARASQNELSAGDVS